MDHSSPILLSKRKAYAYSIILCLSTVYSGISSTLISASSLTQIMKYYHIQLSIRQTLSWLNGILPLGSMLGCLIIPHIFNHFSRKKLFYMLSIASFVSCSLTVIPSFVAIMIGRFTLGILVSFYGSLTSRYIKDFFPPNIRRPFGAVYACGRVVGILACFSISYLASPAVDTYQHLFIFFGPFYICLIQLVSIHKFIPNSPLQELINNNQKQALTSLLKLYDYQSTNIRLQQLKQQLKKGKQTVLTQKQIKNRKRKDFCSIHLALLRQFCGVSFIVVYAGQNLRDMHSPYAPYSSVIINSVQLLSCLVGILMVQWFRRQSLLIFSTWILSLINLLIGVFDILDNSLLVLILLTLFMVPSGSCLSSVAWSYPSELASSSLSKYTSFVSYTGSMIISLIPPYIVARTAGNNAYPIFFFFSLYLAISSILNIRFAPGNDTSPVHIFLKQKYNTTF